MENTTPAGLGALGSNSTTLSGEWTAPGDLLLRAIEGLEQGTKRLERAAAEVGLALDLDRINTLLAEHFRGADSPDGLLAYIEEHRPDLAFRVRKLRAEEADLKWEFEQLRLAMKASVANQAHEHADRLLQLLKCHRQRRTELGFLMYLADTGNGD